ncbi:hypothetical protein ACRJ4W_51030 [Streptomyces sp. GLT-R25]
MEWPGEGVPAPVGMVEEAVESIGTTLERADHLRRTGRVPGAARL